MDKKKLASVLSNSRYESNKSQEYMAEKLNVTRQTIASWESGKSFPDIYETLAWFDALNINSTPYFLQFINQESLDNIKSSDSDKKIRGALSDLVDKLPINYARALLYLLFGSYGGDTESMINLAIAHAHLPLNCRVTAATVVMDMYDMCESRELLKDTGHIMPNKELVEIAIAKARVAAKNFENGYQITNPK